MKLADKIRYLREIEGDLRGLGRAMTQQELVKAIQAQSDDSQFRKKSAKPGGISQSYLSQIESGARPHLTNTTRLILAKFFKVHPGYLVDDPEGYHAELMSEARDTENKLDLWLAGGAERFRRDAELSAALLALADHHDSRRCLLLLRTVIKTPGLVDRLCEALTPTLMPPLAEPAAETPRRNTTTPQRVSAQVVESGRPKTSLSSKAARPRKGAARGKRK